MVQIPKVRKIFVISVTLFLFCGCSKKDDEQQSQGQSSAPSASTTMNKSTTSPEQSDPPVDLAKAQSDTRKKLMEMNKGKAVEPLSLDKLKSFLPAELPGMERKSASAQRNQMMGVDLASAEARYEAADSGSIDITIMDTGNLSGPMKIGLTGWTMSQFERETDTGYEKTTKYGGYKALEEYDRSTKEGNLRLYVADRFVVEAEGNQTTMEQIKQAVDKIDLKKLATMASD
jgi:hypothetical protein